MLDDTLAIRKRLCCLCTGSILYGGRIKYDFDTVEINLVGSHLYRTMDSFHKTHTLA